MVERDGATVRVEIGTKAPLRDIEWSLVPIGTLVAADIEDEEVEAARPACHFPADAT